MVDGVEITWIGGNCPVQSEGTVDGLPYYFRARGMHWALEIEEAPGSTWRHEEPYGTGPFDAGWMPEDEALSFIEKAVGLFRSRGSGAAPSGADAEQ
ncbi:conserved hypothetical protein [Hyphomicrobiales bacterium]|jgi:hypothetical protein|nr:conserved hypothetical protein [Hyphomicrobiales bacterium]CAH1702563.1 conserved hypothetical protein [Hyphomicrobiales bacterium]CAI0346766.1 conserved hypothetical protein [Hyphomicrobiales bacterium]